MLVYLHVIPESWERTCLNLVVVKLLLLAHIPFSKEIMTVTSEEPLRVPGAPQAQSQIGAGVIGKEGGFSGILKSYPSVITYHEWNCCVCLQRDLPRGWWIVCRLEFTPVSLASLPYWGAAGLRCPMHFLQVVLHQWSVPGDLKETGEQHEFACGKSAREHLQTRIFLLLPWVLLLLPLLLLPHPPPTPPPPPPPSLFLVVERRHFPVV